MYKNLPHIKNSKKIIDKTKLLFMDIYEETLEKLKLV